MRDYGSIVGSPGAAGATGAGATVVTATAGGRLSLSSTLPVPTADLTAQPTIYYLPYTGRDLALWNGTAWAYATIPDVGVNVGLGTLADATKPYDIFGFFSAGSLAIEIGPVWTSTTARATGLTTVDGVVTKAGDRTRRYLGSFMPSSTTTTVDSSAQRCLWNMYNRVPRSLLAIENTASWTYTTATYRPANNNTTDGVGRASFMRGLDEDAVTAMAAGSANNATAAQAFVGIGTGATSTTSNAALLGGENVLATQRLSWASYCGTPGLGFLTLQRLEFSQAAGTTTWAGTTGAGFLSGLVGEVRA